MPRRAKRIPTAGENPLLMTLRTKIKYMVPMWLKSSEMVQPPEMVKPPFEIFLVPSWLRVPIWSITAASHYLILSFFRGFPVQFSSASDP